MSLNSILNSAQSGLNVAQAGLRTTSDNVANVNTPGYVRKVVDQESLYAGGLGSGVGIAGVRTAADQFLDAASRRAASDGGATAARADLLDQAQSLFGDPNAATSFFSQLSATFSGFVTLAAAPSSTARAQAIPKAQDLFDQAGDLGAGLDDLAAQAGTRIGADIDSANALISQINDLNSEISRATVSGGDASGAQDQQAQALDKLSALIQVQVSPRAAGGVDLRTPDGAQLISLGKAATLAYDGATTPGSFSVTGGDGAVRTLAVPASGEVAGLADLRDSTLPGLKGQLSELIGQTAAQLNAAHNGYSAVPPPQTLTGAATGLDLPTAVSHFTGETTISVTGLTGVSAQDVSIDFDAGTINGAAFTPATFLSTLNGALSPKSQANFSAAGALSLALTPTASPQTAGLVVSGTGAKADPVTGAPNADQGFSSFFGLNDLVTSTAGTGFATGLRGSDASGYAGGAVTFNLTAADGSALRPVTVTPAGGTVDDLLAALNSPASGVGLYGKFSLDGEGRLGFDAGASGVKLGVASDTTQRTGSGVPLSRLFGVGDAARGARLGALSVRPDILGDPSRLAIAKYDPSKTPPLSTSDGSGATALAGAANAATSFAASGAAGAARATLADYSARFGAAVARTADAAQTAADQAAAVKTEVDGRRSSTEGVNIDQELVNLTTYQQAYNASARMIQAAKDVFDTLLSMVGN